MWIKRKFGWNSSQKRERSRTSVKEYERQLKLLNVFSLNVSPMLFHYTMAISMTMFLNSNYTQDSILLRRIIITGSHLNYIYSNNNLSNIISLLQIKFTLNWTQRRIQVSIQAENFDSFSLFSKGPPDIVTLWEFCDIERQNWWANF